MSCCSKCSQVDNCLAVPPRRIHLRQFLRATRNGMTFPRTSARCFDFACKRIPNAACIIWLTYVCCWRKQRTDPAPQQMAGAPRMSSKWAWIVAASLGTIALALGLTHVISRQPPPARPAVVQFQIAAPDGGRIEQFAFSPDGSHLVLRSGDPPRLWLRTLNSPEFKSVAGSENATYPFWAPASDWLAYFRDGRLYKVALTGGPAQPIANAPNPRGGAWAPSGDIIFAGSPGDGSIG